MSETKHTEEFKQRKERNRKVFSDAYKKEHPMIGKKSEEELAKMQDIAVVSLTSHPGRISVVGKTIETLVGQTVRPKRIVLWLSQEEFPNKEKELPHDLIVLKNTYDYFQICWVKEDLKPHKKYFYAMQTYRKEPVIIVDDDVYYDTHLVEYLLDSYERFPDCISAMRANLIGFRRDGSFMDYDGWTMGYRVLQDTPSTQLVPTGVGGVLYPPNCMPEETFDSEVIKDTCLLCDDLWLKLWAAHRKIKTVMPEHFCIEKLIEGSQEVALWRKNVRQGNNNDESFARILTHYDEKTGQLEEMMDWLRKDRFC